MFQDNGPYGYRECCCNANYGRMMVTCCGTGVPSGLAVGIATGVALKSQGVPAAITMSYAASAATTATCVVGLLCCCICNCSPCCCRVNRMEEGEPKQSLFTSFCNFFSCGDSKSSCCPENSKPEEKQSLNEMKGPSYLSMTK